MEKTNPATLTSAPVHKQEPKRTEEQRKRTDEEHPMVFVVGKSLLIEGGQNGVVENLMATRFASCSALQFVNGGQAQNSDLVSALNEICKNCEKALAVRARDAQTYSAWGSALLQLAFTSNDNSKKLQYLKLSREKLGRAVDINPKVTTPDKSLAIFELGNALYMTYLLEADSLISSNFLDKCRAAYKKGAKLDSKTGDELLSALTNAQNQRAEVQATLQRFDGKSEAERGVEYRMMVEEQAQKAQAAAEACPDCARTLLASGQALVELSLVQERDNTPDAMERARASITKAVEHLSKSAELEPRKEALALLALGLNALGICNSDPSRADALFREARGAFSSAISAATDEAEAANMLLQLRDMYKTGETWRTLHARPLLPGEEEIFEAEPQQLARLMASIQGASQGSRTQAAPPAAAKPPKLRPPVDKAVSQPPPSRSSPHAAHPLGPQPQLAPAAAASANHAAGRGEAALDHQSMDGTVGVKSQANGQGDGSPQQLVDVAAATSSDKGSAPAKKARKNNKRRKKTGAAQGEQGVDGGEAREAGHQASSGATGRLWLALGVVAVAAAVCTAWRLGGGRLATLAYRPRRE